MKIYHLLIALIFITVIAAGFSQIDAQNGLLKDMKSNYNSDINMSRFTQFNTQDDLDKVTSAAINNSGLARTGDDDTEDSLLSRASGVFTDFSSSFTTAYTLLTSLLTSLSIPTQVLFWAVSSLLAIFVVVATVAWFKS